MSREADILFSTDEMAALWSDAARIERMLAFEAALARAQARAGLLPSAAAEAIDAAARTLEVDYDALYREGAASATSVVPLVRLLRAAAGDEAARYVHLGATSQDVIDSATMLQVREGIALLRGSLVQIAGACARLATEHRATVMAGRTLAQQAVPVTFGLKAARWLAMACRQVDALDEAAERQVALQFGGAAGTLSALGAAGPEVSALLAEEIGLPEPPLPWHTERDRLAAIVAAVGVVAASAGNIAQDLLLMAQTETGEVAEGGGGGRSSAMPQKRNPVESALARSSAQLTAGAVATFMTGMAHAYERAPGEWQAEWGTVPDVFRFAAGTLAHVDAALVTLVVDEQRMRTNLDLTDGMIMAESLTAALAQQIGRAEAQRLVEQAVAAAQEQRLSLRDAALATPGITEVFDPVAIDTALEPVAYLGSAGVFIDRALEQYRALAAEG